MRTLRMRAHALVVLAALAGCSLTVDPESVKAPPQAPAGPAVAVSSSSLTFTAVAGGANPAAQTVLVTNSGAGTLAAPVATIAYSTGSGWLAATVTGTAAPYTITVQPTVGSLAAGTYRATVSVAVTGASGSPQAVAVTFNVGSASQPTIALSTSSLTFSAPQGAANPAAQTVAVTNSGVGTLATPSTSVSYGSGSGWLAATVSGTAASYTITVQPTTGALTAGSYTATVTVACAGASNTPQTFSVTFNVTQRPAISLSATTLTFGAPEGGANPTAQTVQITNSGGGALATPTATVSYTSGTGWLGVSVSGTGPSFTLTVQPTTGALAVGTYQATVSVASAGASNTPRTLTVTFDVGTGPMIALQTYTLSFSATQGGSSPAGQAVTVTNGGVGTLATPTVNVSYTNGSAWLAAAVTGTSVPYTVTVTPTLGSLAAGTYRATVAVAANGAANSPQTIAVTFTVGSTTQPTIALAPASVTFTAVQGGASPAFTDVGIQNTGAGSLATPTATVAYVTGAGWLSAAVSGSSAPFTLRLTPTLGSLSAGTYTANVSVTSSGASNSPVLLPVTLTVLVPPALTLSTTALAFGAVQGGSSPTAQTVSVGNSGQAPLAGPTTSISYGSGAGWLSATVSGTVAPYTVTIAPTTGALAAGTYTATVSIASTGASNTPRAVAVTFTVDPQPTLQLSTQSVAFSAIQAGGSPTQQTVAVGNGGGGTLAPPTASVSYTTGTGWLSATVSGTAAPYTIAIQPTTGALTAGTYSATVSVASTGATNTPQSVAVTFTVTAAAQPTLAAVPGALTFSALAGGASPAAQNVALSNSGTGTLAAPVVSVAYDVGGAWLSTNLTGSANSYSLTVTPTVSGLAAGTYTATLSVASAGATNTPLSIPVTFTVTTPPSITLSSGAVRFVATLGGAAPAAQNVTVTNGGGGTLAPLSTSITYASGAGWLTATVTGLTVTLQPTLSALSASGSYVATVLVASAGAANSPQPIVVTFDVGQPPVIALSGTSFQFTAVQGAANPSPQTVTVTNLGGGTLATPTVSPTYVNGSGWVQTTVTGTSAPYTVSIQPLTTGLAAGTYAATLAIASSGASNSPQTVAVSFSVGSPSVPTIALSKTSLAFAANVGAANPAADTVTITNSGSGTLATPTATISYDTGTGWLSASVTGGPTYGLHVQPSTTTLAAGTYTATVNVASAGASNTPQAIAVTYTVTGVSACVTAASGHKLCGSAGSAGGAERVGAASGHAVRRSSIDASRSETVQSTGHQVARGTVHPAAAKP